MTEVLMSVVQPIPELLLELRVLIVEDDTAFAEGVAKAVAKLGCLPVRVSRGADAPARLRETDLVLLDLQLPDCSARSLDVLRSLREVTDVPIIVLTAEGADSTVVRALILGADDYIVKPVREEVLLARVRAVVRRSQLSSQQQPRTVLVRDVEIDLAARRVLVGGTEVGLTRIEFDVLAVLARNLGVAVDRRRLLVEVWGDASAATESSLGNFVTGLRHKLDRPGLIVTIYGFGYRLEG